MVDIDPSKPHLAIGGAGDLGAVPGFGMGLIAGIGMSVGLDILAYASLITLAVLMNRQSALAPGAWAVGFTAVHLSFAASGAFGAPTLVSALAQGMALNGLIFGAIGWGALKLSAGRSALLYATAITLADALSAGLGYGLPFLGVHITGSIGTGSIVTFAITLLAGVSATIGPRGLVGCVPMFLILVGLGEVGLVELPFNVNGVNAAYGRGGE